MLVEKQEGDLPIYIIGAGISGLACAKKLKEFGKNVVVLEARSRIGGRIDSRSFGSDGFDLGASWIHGIIDNPIWKITQKNGIETTVFNYDESEYFHSNGEKFSRQEVEEFQSYIKTIEKALSHSNKRSAFDAVKDIISTLTYSGEILPEEYLKELLFSFFERLANDPFATNLELLPANYSNFEGYFLGDEVIFKQGYVQVVNSISHDLNIKLKTTIQQIILEKDYVKIVDHHNNTYLASHLVLTVSAGVLKNNVIQFTPELPKEYTQAIKNIGFGSFNKVFFELKKPLSFQFDASENLNSIFYWSDGICFNILDLSSIYQKPVYLMLFGGRQSDFIDQSSDDEVWMFILDSLAHKVNMLPRKAEKLIITRWGVDEYSYGSFSFPSLAYDSEMIKLFHEPIDNRIYFAGEHCSLNYTGTVHGAYLSGCEVAQKLNS
ncbi:hypothetical protein B9T31_15215 [Acinetobacter sp. ANC 4558]|nr:hypothetical protein B9T31_15215 [Acinetobacter sp. ANC 4558]